MMSPEIAGWPESLGFSEDEISLLKRGAERDEVDTAGAIDIDKYAIIKIKVPRDDKEMVLALLPDWAEVL